MKYIIDIEEKYYNDICNSETASKYSVLYALNGIRNGTPLEEELEKIKSKIGEAYPYFDETDVQWGFNICRDIIDKHIKELKGE